MQSLLSPASPRENGAVSGITRTAPVVRAEEKVPTKGRLRDMRGTVVGEIQATLREYGVNAESHEIADALIEALLQKPNLCKGLFAAYMLKW